MGTGIRKYVNIVSLILLSAAFAVMLIAFEAIGAESRFFWLWLWPFAYVLYCLFVFGPYGRIKPQHLLGITLISVLEFFPRYVLYPFFVWLAGAGYSGVVYAPLTEGEVLRGILIGFVELLAVGGFLYFFERIKSKKNEAYDGELSLAGNTVIYLLFVGLAVVLYFAVGRQNKLIQFFYNASTAEEVQTGAVITLAKYVISLGLLIAALLIISLCKKRFDKNGGRLYAVFAILVAMLYTGFIIGTSRSTQLAIGFLMSLILIRCFPSMKKEILASISVVIALVFTALTFLRTGETSFFRSGSLKEVADKFQIYFGGPQSIAQSIKAVQFAGKDNAGQLVFDFVRSCFPFNLIIKSSGFTTNQWYNLTIYDGRYPNGQLLFSSSYGFLFLSYPGIALDTILNVFLMLKSSECFYRARSYEGKYLAGFCLIRFVFTIMENTPSVLGSVTQYIGTLGLLVFISRRLTFQKTGIQRLNRQT